MAAIASEAFAASGAPLPATPGVALPDSGTRAPIHTAAMGPEGGAVSLLSLTVRRVSNPRYRAPAAARAGFVAPAALRARSLDVAAIRLVRRDGAGPGATDWEAHAGEETPAGNRIAAGATGVSRAGATILRTAILETRRDRWSAAAGDITPVRLAPETLPLHGVRGASFALDQGERGAWSAIVGGPSPAAASVAGAVRLGAVAVRDVRVDVARISASIAGFVRHAARPGPGAGMIAGGDSVAGGGGQTSLGWSAAIPGGSLSGNLLAQMHDLDGHRALALQHLVAWRVVTPGLAAELRDQRGSPRLRRLAADRLGREQGSDTRATVQSRLPGGRAEWHATGYARSGGGREADVSSLQTGASGSLSGPWHGGVDAHWERRAGAAHQRLAFHAGRSAGAGLAWNARAERTSAPGDPVRDQLRGEALVPLGMGARIALQPKLAWWASRLDEASLRTEFTAPVDRWSGRVSFAVAAGVERDRAFRPRLRDLALAFVWTPGTRDRAGIEVRRVSEGGPARSEITLDGELQRHRHAFAASARDTGSLRVRVVRAGNHTGVADALVSLDGTEFRYTDAEGWARFDRLAPGVHVVALDERSLGEHQRPVGPARAFASVERGVPASDVVFVVARPAKRSSF